MRRSSECTKMIRQESTHQIQRGKRERRGKQVDFAAHTFVRSSTTRVSLIRRTAACSAVSPGRRGLVDAQPTDRGSLAGGADDRWIGRAEQGRRARETVRDCGAAEALATSMPAV